MSHIFPLFSPLATQIRYVQVGSLDGILFYAPAATRFEGRFDIEEYFSCLDSRVAVSKLVSIALWTLHERHLLLWYQFFFIGFRFYAKLYIVPISHGTLEASFIFFIFNIVNVESWNAILILVSDTSFLININMTFFKNQDRRLSATVKWTRSV